LRDRCGPCLAAGKQVDELVYHHALQRADRVPFGKQIVGMSGQDLQQATIPRYYREVHDTLW
jgi:hypothetical protein